MMANADALQYVPEKRCTPDLCLVACRASGWALKYVPVHVENYETLCSIAIQHDPEYLDFVDADKRTYALCLQAVMTSSESDSGDYIRHVPTKHRTLELCMAAVQHDGIFALEHVPIEHRTDAVCTKAVQWAVDLWHECGGAVCDRGGV